MDEEAQVVWKEKRAELVLNLRDLASDKIVNIGGPELREIVHFFFDDTDLFPDAVREVGRFIDEGEVGVLNEFTTKFDETITTMDSRVPSDIESNELQALSQRALAVLAESAFNLRPRV